MAGDWIAWCKGLDRKPEVLAIAKATKRNRREVAATLMAFWEWADEQTSDGIIPNAGLSDLPDLIAGTTLKFWEAVVGQQWLVETPGGLVIPKFSRWLGQSAKSRLAKNARQANWRSPGQGDDVDVHVPTDVDACASTERTTKAPTREPERTEEKKNAAARRRGGPPKPASPQRQATDAFCQAWQARYGEKYSFSGAKDGSAVSWMLAELGGDLNRWRSVVASYVASDDQFLIGVRHELGLLRSQFNRWKMSPQHVARASGKPGQFEGTEGFLDALRGKQHGDTGAVRGNHEIPGGGGESGPGPSPHEGTDRRLL